MKVLKKSIGVGGKVILNKQDICHCQSNRDACRDVVGVGSLANECDCVSLVGVVSA